MKRKMTILILICITVGAACHAEQYNLQDASIGSSVQFGTYEQDNDLSNGTEIIEWTVLDKKENKLLLISTYNLDCLQTHAGRVFPTWEKSDIRKWLNYDFLIKSFSEEELRRIPLSSLTTPSGGADTEDFVFLLSREEAKKYFSNNKARQTQPTYYAVMHGDTLSPSTSARSRCQAWWLRSPMRGSDYFADYASLDGSINNYYAISDFGGIRPALWINVAITANDNATTTAAVVLEKDAKISASNERPTGLVVPLSECAVGDKVEFGKFPYYENGKKANIIWNVMAIESGKALLLSEKILDSRLYSKEGYDPTNWEDCALRSWLNGKFLDSAFTSKERKRISRTSVDSTKNHYGASQHVMDGPKTQDYVFLFSADEIIQYFNIVTKDFNPEMKVAALEAEWTEYALKRVDQDYLNGGTQWWLRTPGYRHTGGETVKNDGFIFEVYHIGADQGVRPALWVNLP